MLANKRISARERNVVMTSNRRPLNRVYLCVAIVAVACVAYGQSPHPGIPTRNAQADQGQAAEDLQKRIEDVRKEVEAQRQQIERRFDIQNEANNRQLESVSRATEWMFRIMAGIAVIGSLFGVASWFKSRQDYQQERKFYEERIKKIDEAQSTLTTQQISIGQNLVVHSDEMLKHQIASIGGLGSVIDLVKRTFEMQLGRQQEMELVTDLRTHFDAVYSAVSDGILSFSEHSRMAWTQLSAYEESLTNGARSDFRTIPDVVLKRQQEKDRYGFAHVLQLLGVSAFYANDIEWAERHLQRAKQIYRQNEAREQDLFPNAFCSHFLGLIAKNWLREGRFIEATLVEAKTHLQDAMALIGNREGEFLTPLTMAEVLSYSDVDQEAARVLLDKKLNELEALKLVPDGLNDNQNRLLGRAYLMRGNLAFVGGRLEEALAWYRKADSHRENDYAAQLSIALAIARSEAAARKEQFERGLRTLETSDAIGKREVSTRAIALAWAIIATCETGEPAKRIRHLKALDALKSEIRSAGGRQPLFFCPATKSLCTFDRLKQNLVVFVSGVKAAATTG
jgi:tetratricopeptide (TPR) repeat protein